jgi:two-component system, LytTR family, response regulator
VDPVRLAAAIERLPVKAGVVPAPAEKPARLANEDKVFLREGDRCWFVEVKQIRLLESEGNYTRVHLTDAQPQLFRSLNAMEERLDPKYFFRANRRQIINLVWIDKIEPWFSGGLLVQLKNGVKVELSRRQAQEFREKMSL